MAYDRPHDILNPLIRIPEIQGHSKWAWWNLCLRIADSNKNFIPEPTARSAVPGVSPGRGLLIPHGYLHPGKCEHSEVLRSVKSINNRGRVTMFQGWTSH